MYDPDLDDPEYRDWNLTVTVIFDGLHAHFDSCVDSDCWCKKPLPSIRDDVQEASAKRVRDPRGFFIVHPLQE